ncbi:MAG: hypothetical protein Q8L37_05820 [Candidatus Gottesmanbacteria bacterium]|nr:hypothetical protein [Candidatus Gottesmanbacteria bacterium]
MAKSSDINLLKAKTMLTPQWVAIDGQLRTISIVLLIVLVLSGLFFGIGYAILRSQFAAMSAQKQTLMTAIGGQLRKEGLFASLKDRIAITGRILEGQRSWLGVLDLIDRITASGTRTSFSVGENDEVNLSITNKTLEDTFRVVERVLTEVARKTIANPILESVQYQKDGVVKVSLIFTPIF